jgi:hypothetical protein
VCGRIWRLTLRPPNDQISAAAAHDRIGRRRLQVFLRLRTPADEPREQCSMSLNVGHKPITFDVLQEIQAVMARHIPECERNVRLLKQLLVDPTISH